MNEEFLKNLKVVWSNALKAYLDSYMYLTAVNLDLTLKILNSKKRSSFHFLYTYFAIQKRLIISTKALIEPCKPDKINLDYIIKQLKDKEEFSEIINDYNNLFKSKEAKDLKFMRDNIVHPLKDCDKAMCLCNDFMFVLGGSLRILSKLNLKFNKKIVNINKIIKVFENVSKKYWENILNYKEDENFEKDTMFIQNIIDNPLE